MSLYAPSTDTGSGPLPTVATSELTRISLERRGHVLLIGLDRAAKRNAFDLAMLGELAVAYGILERDPDLWAGVLFAHGDHFTAGLDLAEVGPALAENPIALPPGALDPCGLAGPVRNTPLVAAVQGRCLTLGIELLLASEIRIAATDSLFAQIEIARGIYPFGGATLRFPRETGWGNAMRWILTGDTFDAAEAHRIGLVQETVAPGEQLDRAIALAETIAAQAPLAVRQTIVSARRSVLEGETEGAKHLHAELLPLLDSEDAKEGLQSFIERRKANFTGR